MRVLASVALALGLGLCAPASVSAAALDGLLSLAPNKQMSPTEVVRAQLASLSHNGHLGDQRGIEVVFRFASPGNREAVGPLPRFVKMIQSGYDAMLDHQASELGPTEMEATKAMQVVYLKARDGSVHAYVFVLSLQEKGEYRGCWMTDAVMELALGEPKAPEDTAETPARRAI